MPSFPVHHQLLEFAQTHVHRVSDAIHHDMSLNKLWDMVKDMEAWSAAIHGIPNSQQMLASLFSLQIFNTSQARSTQHSQYLLKPTKMQYNCDRTLACFWSDSPAEEPRVSQSQVPRAGRWLCTLASRNGITQSQKSSQV